MTANEGRPNIANERWFENLQPYLGDDGSTFHCIDHVGVGVNDRTVSYGINNRADLLRSSDKVVLLDYKRTLAHYVGPVVGNDETWRGFYDDWSDLNAPRHRGRMNVLFRDGRVESAAPADINPLTCLLYNKHWKPARQPRFDRNCVTESEVEEKTVNDPPASDDDVDVSKDTDDDDLVKYGLVGDDPSDSGLIWLVRHEMRGGGWSLKHHMGGLPQCAGRCSFEADEPRRALATAWALLVFLGSGNGPGTGDYQEVVSRGINHLIKHVKANGDIAGNNYERAFVALTLVEALRAGAASGTWGSVDPDRLRVAVERAVARIAACEYVDGGYRYACGQAPDTSVTAAVVHPIKSAEAARLNVPGLVGILSRIHDWLDQCQYEIVQDVGDGFWEPRFANLGTKYGYTTISGSQRMWAAGGYMRVYLNPELKYHQAMVDLCRTIHNIGPQQDRYFNFYAHHFMRMMGEGGPGECAAYWGNWRNAMDQLMTSTRELDGHERGSWDDPGNQFPWANRLGRHGVTCLSLLTLKDFYANIQLTD